MSQMPVEYANIPHYYQIAQQGYDRLSRDVIICPDTLQKITAATTIVVVVVVVIIIVVVEVSTNHDYTQ